MIAVGMTSVTPAMLKLFMSRKDKPILHDIRSAVLWKEAELNLFLLYVLLKHPILII